MIAVAVPPSDATPPAFLEMGAPMGVAFGPTYGFPPAKAEVFMPQVRALGAKFVRLNLYWSQLEPRRGVFRWDDLDAFLTQLRPGDEAILTIASASPWATRTRAWVFPSSPAIDPGDYAAFVRRVVLHTKGAVRYFQNDQEPNNPFFWKGSADDFIAEQKTFYRAVKAADPSAVVVLGGCDGLFDPTGQHPIPGQAAVIDLFSKVIREAQGDYEVFDLRLYADPYTIPARVAFIHSLMAKAGSVRPIIATEYDGPGFFEFPANRRWAAKLSGPSADSSVVQTLSAQGAALPDETRMFLPAAPQALHERLTRLQARDLVIRNTLAFSSGIQKTAFWDLWHQDAGPDSPRTILYGTLKLLEHQDGVLSLRLPLAEPFRRLSETFSGATLVQRVSLSERPDAFVFRIERVGRRDGFIAWNRGEGRVDPVEIAGDLGVRPFAYRIDGAPVVIGHRGKSWVLPIEADPIIVEGVKQGGRP